MPLLGFSDVRGPPGMDWPNPFSLVGFHPKMHSVERSVPSHVMNSGRQPQAKKNAITSSKFRCHHIIVCVKARAGIIEQCETRNSIVV